MCDISIIIGFKNREIQRVENCLKSLEKQSFKNFEVIFVDYGSDVGVSEKTKELVESFSFSKYLFNNTRGMYWNRSHALNSGVIIAKGTYIYLSDIDIVYSVDFLKSIFDNATEKKVIYNQFYLLPDNIKNNLNNLNIKNLKLITKSAKGNCLMHREVFMKLRGYDEYYCIWGVEDNDMSNRLLLEGIEEEWVNHIDHPTFHIWHPEVSNETKNLMPEKWMDEMIFYFLKNKNQLIRNSKEFGHCYINEERYALMASENKIPIDYQLIIKDEGFSSAKSLQYRTIYSHLEKMENKQILEVMIPKYSKTKLSRLHTMFVKFIEKILVRFKSPVRIIDYRLSNRERYFIAELDIHYFIWKIIKESDLIFDYVIVESQKEVKYYLSKYVK